MVHRDDTKFQTRIEKYAIPNDQIFTMDDIGTAFAFNIFGFAEDGSILPAQYEEYHDKISFEFI